MLFDDDYNTYEETPFVTVEAASEQLLTGVLTNIHEFEMGLVLSEYKYLAEHGYEMALSEAEWWDNFKDNIRDLWQNAVRKIKEYFRNFAGWCAEMYDRAMKWLRTIGMTKESASKAIAAYKKRKNKTKVAKANGVLVTNTNALVDAIRKLARGQNMTMDMNKLGSAAIGSAARKGAIDVIGMNSIILDGLKISQFKGGENSFNTIEQQVKAYEFDIGADAANESFNLLFQYKDVVRSIKQMESDLISSAEKQLNSFRVTKSNKAPGVFSTASQNAKDDYRKTVENIKD